MGTLHYSYSIFGNCFGFRVNKILHRLGNNDIALHGGKTVIRRIDVIAMQVHRRRQESSGQRPAVGILHIKIVPGKGINILKAMDSPHRGDFDTAAGGIPAMQQPQRSPVFGIISSVLVLLVNHRVHADGITVIGRRLRREGLRRLHLPFLLGIGIINLPDTNAVSPRVRVPDRIKRNIDNLPNPVAARRLILRHRRTIRSEHRGMDLCRSSCVPVVK